MPMVLRTDLIRLMLSTGRPLRSTRPWNLISGMWLSGPGWVELGRNTYFLMFGGRWLCLLLLFVWMCIMLKIMLGSSSALNLRLLLHSIRRLVLILLASGLQRIVVELGRLKSTCVSLLGTEAIRLKVSFAAATTRVALRSPWL